MSFLEVQIKDEEDFKKVLPYSDYFSEITKVCSFNSNKVNELNQIYPGLLEKYTNDDLNIPDPLVILENNKIKVKFCDIDTLAYLDIRSTTNTEVKIVNMNKLFPLIKNKIIKTDKSFDEVMTKLNINSKVSELFSANGKMNFRGKRISLNDIDGLNTIRNFEFSRALPLEKNYFILKNLVVLKYDSESKFAIMKNDHDKYKVKFYYVTPIMLSCLKEGRKINIACNKVYGNNEENEFYEIMDPIIVPDKFNIKSVKLLKSPRTIPSALYNAAYSEFVYRGNL